MIDFLKSVFDPYTFQARLLPAMLVVSPVGITVAGFFPEKSWQFGFITGLFCSCALGGLFAQIGRDAGKRKEIALFSKWGGSPTVNFLRYNGSSLNEITLARYHSKLQVLLPDLTIPSEKDENSDPIKADRIYESCIFYLKEKGRDKQVFPLLFAENINYGYRRNLWGMKGWALIILVICILLLFQNFNFQWRADEAVNFITATALGINTLLFLCWSFLINDRWVHQVAKMYAERLLAVLDQL